MSGFNKNILNYLKEYGNILLSEMNFNEVDSLILCQLTYLNYSGFVDDVNNNSRFKYLKEIYDNDDYENIFKGYWYYDENKELVERLVNSKRFGDIRLNYYQSIYEENTDTQFAAITYQLGDGSFYVAFRGTDATIIGWKEDFKMAYSKPIQSQKLAVSYIEDVAELVGHNFRTGGHSKGGNLAVYASVKCKRIIQDRIIDIYSHDGPGFRPEVIGPEDLLSIKNRLHKYIPAESIVGIIMNEVTDCEVIDSYGIGTLQHNTYSWKCDGGNFVNLESRTGVKIAKDRALNQWIYSLSENELDEFIDILYGLLTTNDAKTVYDLIENPKEALDSMKDAYKGLDDSAKDMLTELFVRLRDITYEYTKNEYHEREQEFMDNLKDNFEMVKESMKVNVKEVQSYIQEITQRIIH